MDEIESDEALRFYQFLNYLDGGSFGTGKKIINLNKHITNKLLYLYIMNFLTGPIDEFVDAMSRLASYMKQQNSRETQVRGMRELEAINGEKGNIVRVV